jgi:hypothetical protein
MAGLKKWTLIVPSDGIACERYERSAVLSRWTALTGGWLTSVVAIRAGLP